MTASYPTSGVCERSEARGTVSLHGDELVADLAHRDDALGVRRVALELAPQVRDVHVARAGVADERRPPDVLHDLAAAPDVPRPLGEQREELELGRREPHARAVDLDLVAREVD